MLWFGRPESRLSPEIPGDTSNAPVFAKPFGDAYGVENGTRCPRVGLGNPCRVFSKGDDHDPSDVSETLGDAWSRGFAVHRVLGGCGETPTTPPGKPADNEFAEQHGERSLRFREVPDATPHFSVSRAKVPGGWLVVIVLGRTGDGTRPRFQRHSIPIPIINGMEPAFRDGHKANQPQPQSGSPLGGAGHEKSPD